MYQNKNKNGGTSSRLMYVHTLMRIFSYDVCEKSNKVMNHKECVWVNHLNYSKTIIKMSFF